MLFTRTDVEATILKVPGQLYQEQPDDRISNLYNIQFINKTNHEIPLKLKVKDHATAVIRRVGDEKLMLKPGERLDGVFFIDLPKSEIKDIKTKLTIQLISNGEVIDEINTNFIGSVTLRKK